MPDNILYYGDNLPVLREHLTDESVDLVYLDPPFNSNATYNVLFAEKNGSESAAQIKAFEDTWHWDANAARTYGEVVESGGRVSEAMQAFRKFFGRDNDMLAYLTMMAPRLVELRRVLKPTGSIYLHCDPTASHYLKMLMDAVFGGENYRNEIMWKRTSAHNDPKRFGKIHDILLYYSRDVRDVAFYPVYVPYSESYIEAEFRKDEQGRWYKAEDLTAPYHGGEGGRFEFHGRTPGPSRMWRLSEEEMERLWNDNRIKKDKHGRPLLRGQIVYLDEKRGMPVQDIWDDVLRIGNTAKERLPYPTQKPEALLERIIQASSNEGDTVLDPFCGCGTTIAVAQKLRRRWIGIDITHLATNLIKTRLDDTFGEKIREQYKVIGEPTTVYDAEQLAKDDRWQFQLWALGLIPHAHPSDKKGADRGIDGKLPFLKDLKGNYGEVIFSVKSGHVTVSHVRDLVGVVEREDAQVGVLVSLNEPTQAMRAEVASAGFYESPWGKHPRIQLITVGELLEGKRIDFPYTRGVAKTFKQAPKHNPGDGAEQTSLIAEQD